MQTVEQVTLVFDVTIESFVDSEHFVLKTALYDPEGNLIERKSSAS